ncbi:unnamed protein product [Cercopithifilaria johnstoni]|uniref:G-protein coupled receptors family 1 profile domain-containing protein n=1 Tax=Cercopithifilaria johnstoni TaxID=2874296 RepID=A0A8J2LUZ3_9BILA|nr:unnamed protein product [Cercopithifilaria johnstoni]
MTIVDLNFEENIIKMICIVVISLLGFISNGLSLHITTTNSQFQNAYGILRTTVLLCNIQTISIILIWAAVILLTGLRKLSSSTYSIALIPGCLANVSLYGAVSVNLLIAVNRYCAFAYPLNYHFYWTVEKARRAGIIVYFFGFLPCFPSIFEPCTLIFNAELDFRWSYSNTSCGNVNSTFDTMFTISTMIIAGCIDFMTFLRIRSHNKLLVCYYFINYLRYELTLKTVRKLTALPSNRKNDIYFFKQSCISGLTMIISSLVFNIGQHFLTNKWALFAATTIGWEMAHVLDG